MHIYRIESTLPCTAFNSLPVQSQVTCKKRKIFIVLILALTRISHSNTSINKRSMTSDKYWICTVLSLAVAFVDSTPCNSQLICIQIPWIQITLTYPGFFFQISAGERKPRRRPSPGLALTIFHLQRTGIFTTTKIFTLNCENDCIHGSSGMESQWCKWRWYILPGFFHKSLHCVASMMGCVCKVGAFVLAPNVNRCKKALNVI